MAKRAKCVATFRDGGDLTHPCFGMESAMNYQGQRSGMAPLNLVNLLKNDMGRRLMCLYSGNHKRRGLILNFCPFCGTRIFDPAEADKAARVSKKSGGR